MIFRIFMFFCFFGYAFSQTIVDKILMKNLTTINFYKDRMTVARRHTPQTQLVCMGGTAGCAQQPDVVYCYNSGVDGMVIEWDCEAKLPKGIRFGDLKVNCEGYEHGKDPYILVGSCALQYTLEAIQQSGGLSPLKYGIIFAIITSLIALFVCCCFCCKLIRECLCSPNTDHHPATNANGYHHPPVHSFHPPYDTYYNLKGYETTNHCAVCLALQNR